MRPGASDRRGGAGGATGLGQADRRVGKPHGCRRVGLGHAPADGLRRPAGLRLRVRQLGGDLLEGTAHDVVGLHQPLAGHPQLLELDLGHPAAAGEVAQHALPDGPGFGHHLLAVGAGGLDGGLGLGLSLVTDGPGVGLRRLPQAGRHAVGLLHPAGHEVVGLLAHAGDAVLGVPQDGGRGALGLGGDGGGRLPGAGDQPPGVLAQAGGQRRLVELGVGGAGLGVVQGPPELGLPGGGGAHLLGHPVEELPHFGRLVAAQTGGEALPGHRLGRNRGTGGDDDPVVVHQRKSLRLHRPDFGDRDPTGHRRVRTHPGCGEVRSGFRPGR